MSRIIKDNNFFNAFFNRISAIVLLAFILNPLFLHSNFDEGLSKQLTNIQSFGYENSDAEMPLAFPGADGWGRYTTGGRGGEVLFVTNLNDSGTGSLRDAINATGIRTIIFRVSGTIELKSLLRIRNGNVTIAGQTAPGDGICIMGYPVQISADNVIIRHLRFRLGDFIEDDSFKGTDRKDIIIDHCSMSWGVDEVASFYRNENFTMQNCIIAESLYRSVHAKGDHGYGGIWGGNKASFLRNLIAHHTSRTPRFNGARYSPPKDDNTDFRNNVIYNWGFNNVYGGDPNETTGTKANINIVNNYYKPGPATNSGQVAYRILEPYSKSTFGYSLFYVDGNMVHGYPNVLSDNWGLGVQGVSAGKKVELRVDTPFQHIAFETLNAQDAYEFVLDNAGARIPKLDIHDLRVIHETREGTATYGGVYKGPNTGIIDKPSDVGGWPVLFSAPQPIDTDGDGMPDEWENENGLDPSDPSDRNDDIRGEGYTNLEYYINSITSIENFIKPPTELSAVLSAITTISLQWIDNSDSEEGFLLERKSDGDFSLVKILEPDTQSYVDSLLGESTNYTYRVRAYSSTDTSIFSNTANATTYSYSSVPKPVINHVPSDNSNDLRNITLLSWDPSLGATSYDVYFGENNPPVFIENRTECNFEPVIQPGKTYYWRVEAKNENGSTVNNKVWRFSVRDHLPNQLVGHWSLDSYISLLDDSGFENNGSAINLGNDVTIENGPHKGAIKFNGTNQYIQIPQSFEFDFEANSFTAACWIKLDLSLLTDKTKKAHPILFKGVKNADPLNPTMNRKWEIYTIPAEQKFVFSLFDGDITSTLETGASHFITDNWVHVIAVRDTSERKLKVYSNGVLIEESDDRTADLSQDGDLYIAHRPTDLSYLSGSVDDVRLYNYALSQDEINQLLGVLNFHTSNDNKFDIELYPNPTSNFLKIKMKGFMQKGALLKISDTSGRVVKSFFHHTNSLNNELILDLSDVSRGSYFLTIISSEQIQTKKVMLVY
jgi:hypothetical protein